MISTLERLDNIHTRLLNTELVSRQCVTSRSIHEFEQELARAAPNTDQERGAANFARAMYLSDPGTFVQWANATHNQYVLLFTEGDAICDNFGMSGLIRIYWCYDANAYRVTSILDTFSTVNDEVEKHSPRPWDEIHEVRETRHIQDVRETRKPASRGRGRVMTQKVPVKRNKDKYLPKHPKPDKKVAKPTNIPPMSDEQYAALLSHFTKP